MSEKRILNFSIGPVQGFIAMARKTRDFWSGSFLLSFLAGQAMAEVLKAEGKLILPAVAESKDKIDDPLLQAILDRKNGGKTIRKDRKRMVATLPNRFRAEIPSDFDPKLCEIAIKEKWQELAQKIWDRYLAEIAATYGHSTEEIWQRQVNSFWEISWVLGQDPSVLDQRKNWRSHVPPPEPGDKCTLFGTLQELSGYIRISEKREQDKFWEAVRQQVGIYDLEENERLCSIALIKRLFPYIAPEVIYEVPTSYPSTPYLSAVNWIAEVIKNKADEARVYAIEATRRLIGAKERENPELFPVIQQALEIHPQAREFASLNGNFFFKNALENPNLWDKPGETRNTQEEREELIKKLEQLGAPPSPFYAMLLMDGDWLGALLRKYEKKTKEISSALNQFSLQVPETIHEENGVTIFAGGDDVLALLPLENALNTSVWLRSAYREAFTKEQLPMFTISGAIVYAHYTTPLTEVYHEAQRLLSKVAKTETGRDSLAITIWKSAGRVLTWASPWDSFLHQHKGNKLATFVEQFYPKKDDEPKKYREFREFSNTFFYNIQSRLALFADTQYDLSIFDDDQLESPLKALLVAEYLSSKTGTTRQQAEEKIQQLLELCRRSWRDSQGQICHDPKRLYLESIFLIKFLVEKGV